MDDVDALAAAVMDAVSNAHERKRRGRNALELIKAEYRWPVIAGPFEELYLQLTSGPSGQRAAHQSDIDVRALYQQARLATS